MSDLSRRILHVLKAEFIAQGRTADDLSESYVGMNFRELQEKILADGEVSRVDYDLSLKELEEKKLVGTGPMEPFENDPNSSLVFFVTFSKREYIYLTESGYRMSDENQKRTSLPSKSTQHVNISGSTFYQSPIGVGGEVSQNLTFDLSNQNDTVKYLAELLAKDGRAPDHKTTVNLEEMVSHANAGNMAAAKPIFQRIYGAVSEPIKQLALNVVTAIITHQMGLDSHNN